MGDIADRVRDYIPATYSALASSAAFGQSALDRVLETTKFRLFGTAINATLEASTYNPFALDYAAKVATLRIIPAGADYWADQLQSESTNEQTISYPDRINSLWKIHERLLTEMRMDQSLFERLHPPFLRTPSSAAPKVSTEGEFMTPDPADWGHGSTGRNFGNASKDLWNWTRPE